LALKKKKYGEVHPSVANTYFLMGVLSVRQKKYNEGMKLLNKSLEIRLKFHDENHLTVAKIYRMIGVIYQARKNLNVAYNYYLKSHQIRKNILGMDDPGVVYIKNKLETLKKDMTLKDGFYPKNAFS